MSVVDVGIEPKFAECVETFERSQFEDPFQLIQQFRHIASTKAIQVKDQLFQNPSVEDEFTSWQLETKLWHLVEILYSFRLAHILPHKEYSYSSVPVVEENFRKKNMKFAELSMIIEWIQINAKGIDTNVPLQSKWNHTKHYNETQDFLALVNNVSPAEYIRELDADAILRDSKKIHPDDSEIDDQVFQKIYQLVLYRKFDEAITVCNETGNYPLSMILVGDMLPYLDTTLDKEYLEERGIDLETSQGCKHKLMWFQTVYRLSQAEGLNRYEKLIYNFLSGANISENLDLAEDWEEYLLLYCNQVIVNEVLQFYHSYYKNNDLESVDIIIPKPQLSSIEGILNALLKSPVSDDARHPVRIIMGAVMIKKVLPLITDTVKSALSGRSGVYSNTSLLRILVHLSIFIRSTDVELIDATDFTRLCILYLGKLKSAHLYHLIPLYLSFIPNDLDVMEFYAKFLPQLPTKEDKLKQIEVCKKISYFTMPVNELADQDRLYLVLNRTVESILHQTESHYKPDLYVAIQDEYESIDDTDKLVYESVDWLMGNNMYEETIVVSVAIIKRFLITGKLAALKEFSKGKNFKQIINSYDADFSTRKFNSEKATSPVPLINDEDREELLNYDSLIRGLISIGEWNKFIEDQGHDKSGFKTKEVEHSINKITGQLINLIMRWFMDSEGILKQFRHLYVPYLIIEVLKIYEFSRFTNPIYLSKSFDLMKLVANEDENDLLECFIQSGKLNEFLNKCGQVALVASENGLKGIFT